MSEQPNFSTFHGASVLVTGASGFIGGHLVAKLTDHGARVVGLSNTKSIDPCHLQGDMSRMEDVLAAFEHGLRLNKKPVEFVFHLAGQKNPAIAKRFPRESLELSIQGCLNLLEAARQQKDKIQKVVLVSSLAVYGLKEDQSGSPIKEDQALAGDTIYSVTKIAPEFMARAYWCEYGIPTVVARLANVYGPGQSSEAVISSIIQQMLENKNLELGNTTSVRDFTFVEDTAEALMALSLVKGFDGQALNLGSGQAHSIQEIVECIAELTHFAGATQTAAERVRANEKSILIPDIGTFIKITGWAARHTLQSGLAQTVEAFRVQQNRKI